MPKTYTVNVWYYGTVRYDVDVDVEAENESEAIAKAMTECDKLPTDSWDESFVGGDGEYFADVIGRDEEEEEAGVN